jgi:type IV pilus assembly protein PilA
MSEVILGMSACRTSITEVYQSGPAALITPNQWGCEYGGTTATKYVANVNTNNNGMVLATVQGISLSVNGSVVTLTPLSSPNVTATVLTGNSMALFGWRCGLAGDGTTVPLKYLPGSCRG